MTAEPAVAATVEQARPPSAASSIKEKGVRYAGVSLVNVVLGQLLLTIFIRLFSATDSAASEWTRVFRGAEANSIAVFVSAIPAYYLSRTYVWGKRGKSELRREVLPFWIFVLVGYVLSTVALSVAVVLFHAPADAGILHPAKIGPNIASMGAFGVLWVIRFFWMDKAFHLDHHHAHGPLDVLLDEDEPVEPDA